MMIPTINQNSIVGCQNSPSPTDIHFPLGPFTKHPYNPILTPDPSHEWESAYIYNATAIVIDQKIYLFYRAQNFQKISSIGIAWSTDGFNFERFPKPVIFPTEPYELAGGCEDPRIVRDEKTKRFIMTYTAYDGHIARLCVASSMDLFNWKKYPPLFMNSPEGNPLWSKSGAIFTDLRQEDGKYYMVWGDQKLYLAISDDLIHWELPFPDTRLDDNIFANRVFPHESRLIESGPAPIKLSNGMYIFIYNCSTWGTDELEEGSYSISQMLIDYNNITNGPVTRLEKPMIIPETEDEKNGLVNNVVFCEGIVLFNGTWFLYYGQADSVLGVAIAPLSQS
ncbi:uncharacterized protein J8A68_004882 [[Candida] subhashii]|uniref:Glycosidase n=1 Tax=[Candida] subhashii TaxID=561895 RepID=A0A8J5QJI7_9ASCO|nr:uncharacterized protein J8A68_004882 [[Candida] subhashii]KAG7661613.1 hypothetical protein J8A68_004882 [[Candida] subhashii]